MGSASPLAVISSPLDWNRRRLAVIPMRSRFHTGAGSALICKTVDNPPERDREVDVCSSPAPSTHPRTDPRHRVKLLERGTLSIQYGVFRKISEIVGKDLKGAVETLPSSRVQRDGAPAFYRLQPVSIDLQLISPARSIGSIESAFFSGRFLGHSDDTVSGVRDVQIEGDGVHAVAAYGPQSYRYGP
jgi:hypothetical protein